MSDPVTSTERRGKTVAVSLVKFVSNYFWEIADRWSFQNDAIAHLYNTTIGDEYKEEYERCGLHATSRVLHIGCGSYPLTEIVLANVSAGMVTGIDKNARTVRRALAIIARRNLSSRIIIRHGDGLSFPVQDFDYIIVSSCSLPKLEILEYLRKAATPGTHIIVREVDIASDGIQRFIADHPEMRLLTHIRHNPFPFFQPIGWTTFHIQKQ